MLGNVLITSHRKSCFPACCLLFILQGAETRWWSVTIGWLREMLSDPKGAVDTVPWWFYFPALVLGLLAAGVLAALGTRIVARMFRDGARDAKDRRQPDAPETPEVTRGLEEAPRTQQQSQEQTVKVVVEQQAPSSQRPPTIPLLPNPVADFTGRQGDIDKLVARLRKRETAAITAIDGQGGVGKTELACYVGREVRDHYPGGQILLDLRGLDKEPVTAEGAMARVILALEPEQKLPDNPEQIAGLYQGLLAERGVLILADNAKDSDQVEPLIPSPPSALLITSRQTIQLAGMERVDLDELPSQEAHGLLRSILGSKPAADDEVARLARLCGNLPIALRVAGNYLASAPALSVPQYLERLGTKPADMTHQGRKVRAILADSVEALERENPSLVNKWRSLAVFRAPFDRRAAEAVAEFEGDELDTLEGCSLVIYDRDQERFRLHDLVRELGEEGLEEDEAQQAHRRHAAHYLGETRRAIEYYEQHLEITRGTGDRRGEAEALGNLGIAYANLGEARRAIEYYEQRLEITRETGDRRGEGMALGNLGIAYANLGETRRAIEYHERHVEIARETGDRRSEGMALGNLGIAYADLGETWRAIEYYEQQLRITRETGDRRGEGQTLGNLGIAYKDLGEPGRAIEYNEQVLGIARETGDRRGEGQALGNLGLAYAVLGEPRRAIEYYQQHLEIARETGDRRGEGNALWNRALTHDKLGRRDEAIADAELSLKIREEIEDPNADRVRRALANWGAPQD